MLDMNEAPTLEVQEINPVTEIDTLLLQPVQDNQGLCETLRYVYTSGSCDAASRGDRVVRMTVRDPDDNSRVDFTIDSILAVQHDGARTNLTGRDIFQFQGGQGNCQSVERNADCSLVRNPRWQDVAADIDYERYTEFIVIVTAREVATTCDAPSQFNSNCRILSVSREVTIPVRDVNDILVSDVTTLGSGGQI